MSKHNDLMLKNNRRMRWNGTHNIFIDFVFIMLKDIPIDI